MPTMIVRATNSTFESSSSGEFDTVDAAYDAAVRAGLEIAVIEVTAGIQASIVEVAVDLVGQRYAARGAVSVSTSRILSPT